MLRLYLLRHHLPVSLEQLHLEPRKQRCQQKRGHSTSYGYSYLHDGHAHEEAC